MSMGEHQPTHKRILVGSCEVHAKRQAQVQLPHMGQAMSAIQ